ncbi:MAG: hypothetical protein K2X90_02265 [Candidatus Babeliaceae bacterium]|nr:hypothetical protein [Candidatus Babeliaceae bacterium]
MNMNKLKNVLMDILLIISCVTLHAGNGSAGWSAFGGALGGSVLGNVLSQPRQPRTQVVQVPVQQAQAPAPRDDYDDSSATIRKLKRDNKALSAEVEELADEVLALKKEIKILKSENSNLKNSHVQLKEHSKHCRAATAA